MLFAKIFSSMYDGTLCGDWKALVTFQQLLILSDYEGCVDMTPEAIHRITGIPLKIIREGLVGLAQPDPDSRTLTNEGRRIIPIDANRSWGWIVVNKKKYTEIADREQRKIKERQRISEKRAHEKDKEIQYVAKRCKVLQSVANVAYIDLDKEKITPPLPPIKRKKPTCADGFDEFYSLYPRKRSKGQAERAWIKLKPDPVLKESIIVGLQRILPDFLRREPDKVPYPATWLNARGWEDQPDPNSHGSFQPLSQSRTPFSKSAEDEQLSHISDILTPEMISQQTKKLGVSS